jgi:hypothetical protein
MLSDGDSIRMELRGFNRRVAALELEYRPTSVAER